MTAYLTPGSKKLHKATILPRGHSLGATHFIPTKEEYKITKQEIDAEIDVLMGGRAAEEIFNGKD